MRFILIPFRFYAFIFTIRTLYFIAFLLKNYAAKKAINQG